MSVSCLLERRHELSQIGLLDLAFTADNINKVIVGEDSISRLRSEYGILNCLEEEQALAAFETVAVEQGVSDLIETCSPAFLQSWPNLDVDRFLECTVLRLLQIAHEKDESMQQQASSIDAEGTLDTCMAEHSCIGFNDMALDTSRMRSCIGLSRFVSHEGVKVFVIESGYIFLMVMNRLFFVWNHSPTFFKLRIVLVNLSSKIHGDSNSVD
jgi:hypothetical protein